MELTQLQNNNAVSGVSLSLLIVGDSHARSFDVPLRSDDGQNHLVDIKHPQHSVKGLTGAWPRDFHTYWDGVLEHAPGRSVAILWGGNRHLAHFLFAPTPLFDFVVSSNPELPLDETAQIIPEAAMRAFLMAPIQQIERRVQEITAVAAQVLILGTPPPKKDDDFMRARLAKEPHFVRVASQLGLDPATIPFSPPLLRLKMWMALQGLLQDLAHRTGATFVPVPEAAQTGIGYLNPSCYADDVTHANSHFGTVMMPAVLSAAGE